MDKNFFWKNFSLGKELDVAGTFIYNGLKSFDSMETFYFEVEIFEFLYNISVGIERLGKIAVILIEHNENTNQEEFEKSLITHNHQILTKRISKKYDCDFNNIHNSFLQLLSDFYKSMRYDRYIRKDNYSYDKESIALISYLEKNLQIKIEHKDLFGVTRNDTRIKRFIGKIIRKICDEFYGIIENEAGLQNIYTYEIRPESKASKIFLRKEYDFFKEGIVWKEVLIYLLNTKGNNGLLNFIRQIEPLGLDSDLISEYINCFQSDLNKQNLIDEIEEHYYEVDDKKNRLEMIKAINNPNIIWDYEENEDEEDFDTKSAVD